MANGEPQVHRAPTSRYRYCTVPDSSLLSRKVDSVDTPRAFINASEMNSTYPTEPARWTVTLLSFTRTALYTSPYLLKYFHCPKDRYPDTYEPHACRPRRAHRDSRPCPKFAPFVLLFTSPSLPMGMITAPTPPSLRARITRNACPPCAQ